MWAGNDLLLVLDRSVGQYRLILSFKYRFVQSTIPSFELQSMDQFIQNETDSIHFVGVFTVSIRSQYVARQL